MLPRPASWLTAKRIRIHGLLLAVCLWTIYAVDISTPGLRDRYGLVKGTDFLHFYTLGSLALRGRGDLLYDMQAQAVVVRERIPEAAEVFYLPLYGPQVSLLFAPLARLPYGWALTAWLSFNVVIYALCCYAIWKRCANLQSYGWTVTGSSRDISFLRGMENCARRDIRCGSAISAGLGTLWNFCDAELSARLEQNSQCRTIARTASLPDALPALFLLALAALAGCCFRFLYGLRNRGARDRHPMLAEPRAT